MSDKYKPLTQPNVKTPPEPAMPNNDRFKNVTVHNGKEVKAPLGGPKLSDFEN